jgi:transposase-like protein
MERYTIANFNRDFPTDDACLEWLKNYLYPNGIFCEKCEKVTKHHKDTKRPSYSCDRCGHHFHPSAGTIFEKSTTPLKLWFHAIYLMSSTRCGISAKQIERETGVTYKTAWRMFKQIRSMLDEDTKPLSNKVELDETYIGGKAHNMHKSKRDRLTGRGTADKTPVFGAVERQGRVMAVTVPNTAGVTLLPHIRKYVIPSSIIYTDEAGGYEHLNQNGYRHQRVRHSAHIYVSGDIHTNTIEGFWSLLKRGISGVYHAVSTEYLQSYLNEYTFRYNHREDIAPMFNTMLSQVSRT